MKVYRTESGAVIEHEGLFHAAPIDDWDEFINDDKIHEKLTSWIEVSSSVFRSASLEDRNFRSLN